MKKTPSLLIKLILILGLLTVLAAITAGLLFARYFPKAFQNDIERLSTEEYDSVFLSMFPLDNYSEDAFTIWWGRNTVIASHEIPNCFVLECYLKEIAQNSLTTDTIYLGIQPDSISGEKLAALLASYPQYQFVTLFSYPSLEYWTSLSANKCADTLQDYRDCLSALVNQPSAPANTTAYFFGSSEWLIANPANYESDFVTDADSSLTIMLHLDTRHKYYMNAASYSAAIDNLTAIIERENQSPANYPDLSAEHIIFFGDSVIGNFSTDTSIPGVTGALTGAKAYNLGLGGTPATQPAPNAVGLNYILNAFLARDLAALSADSQAYRGLAEYLEDEAAGKSATAPYCFVINYGLNDYYCGYPIASDDPYDVATFAGAFRTAVRDMRAAYPDARILVITPNFTSYFNNGEDPMSDYGLVLTDYVDALIALAEELNIELLDNYHELDINADNHSALLSDGCHPNEDGRFIMGHRIAEKLGTP